MVVTPFSEMVFITNSLMIPSGRWYDPTNPMSTPPWVREIARKKNRLSRYGSLTIAVLGKTPSLVRYDDLRTSEVASEEEDNRPSISMHFLGNPKEVVYDFTILLIFANQPKRMHMFVLEYPRNTRYFVVDFS